MFAHRRTLALLGGLALFAACGGGDGGGGGAGGSEPGFYIVIGEGTFSPAELAVPPGGTVTVLNRDSESHSATSQASAGSFTPGAVAGIQFDTGAFGRGSRTFTIPAGAVVGTVVPYYCTVHTSTMAPSSPTIRVDPAAVPAPAPGSGGGGGGGGGYGM